MTAPEVQLPLVGTVVGDTYRIDRLVAVGGMGELYEATHLRLAGRYAVKVLLPQFATYEEVMQRFAREAEITSRLRHPNIVSVLDFNTTPDGRAFLAMEFLEGRDLAAELAAGGPMSLPRVLAIVGQVISSLAAAHAQGIVHRDLKPQNIFITQLPGDGREMVKVLDFGISKMREVRTKLTREHTIIGTPQYMAPEQALGHGHAIDQRTDQFALASITYELLAGHEAFRAESIPAILYLVVHEAPPALGPLRPDLPPAVERVLLRALAKEPEDRFADISVFGDALTASAQGVAPHEARVTPVPRRRSHVPMSDAPTLRDERRVTTFAGQSADVSQELQESLDSWQRPRQRSQLGVGLLVGGAALGLVGFLATRRPPEAPAGEAAPAPSLAPAPARAPVVPAPRWPPPAPAPAAPAANVAASPAPEAREAPLEVENPPANLRVSVDGQRVVLPTTLARKSGRYLLHFEAPGRQSQTVEVDGMALRHQIPLDMPRVAARSRGPAEERAEPGRLERDLNDLRAPAPRFDNETLPPSEPTSSPTSPTTPTPPAEEPAAPEKPPLIDDI